MYRFRMMLVLAAMVGFASAMPALYAQEEEPGAAEVKEEKKEDAEDDAEDEEQEDEIETYKRMFKDVDDVIGSVTLNDDDIKSYIKHSSDFENLVDENEVLGDIVEDKGYKAGFDAMIKDEKYLAWAKKRELNAEDWLRKSIRVSTFQMRSAMSMIDDEQIKTLEDARALIEAMKGMLDEDEYKKSIAEMDEAIQRLKNMKEFGETLPKPTEAETKLLETHGEELGIVQ